MADITLSRRARQTADQPISYFMKQAVENPHLISLAAGLVDAPSLPAAECQAVFNDILATPASAHAALQYGTTQGYLPLRQQLLDRLVRVDGSVADNLTVDQVVVTSGSQQLLYLVSEMLLDPGDLVIAETPSYFVYQGTLTSVAARTLAVPMDEHGLDTDKLEELLVRLDRSGELARLKLIYVCDYFQNPTGLSLSRQRREHLVELARRFSKHQRLFILEDAAYRELRYEGEDLPSIKSFDENNEHVILAQTFSKPCAPGLKTGYGFLPGELVDPLLRLKGNHDFGSNNLTQHLLERLLATGAYDRHLEELCRIYRNKRDAVLEALQREFAEWPDVGWTRPTGGMYVWLTFPPSVDAGPDSELMRSALREGVLYVPGQFCSQAGDRHVNEARLSFGLVPEERIEEAIRRLGRAVRAELSRADTKQNRRPRSAVGV